MPLTVTVDPGIAGRINITGDAFDFATALNSSRIDITGTGRTVVVTFADPRANIQWAGMRSISSSSYLTGYRGGQQHHMPGEINHSMKGVEHLSGIYLGTTHINSVAFTANYAFMGYDSNVVARRSLATQAMNTADLSGDVDELHIIGYSDEITYVFGRTANSFVVYKVDWSTSPATKTQEAEVISSAVPWSVECCARVRYINNDVFVCTALTNPSGDADKEVFVLLFDLNNDSIISYDEIQPANYPDTTISGAQIQTIAQHEKYVAFIASADYNDDGVIYCGAPIIWANIETGIITITSLPIYTIDLGNKEYELWAGNGYINAAMDNQTGDLYYLTYYNLDDPFTEKTYIRRVSPPAYSPPSVPWDYGDTGISGQEILHYGDGGTIAFRIEDDFNKFIKIVRPNGTALCTLDESQEDNYGAIDDENEMYWMLDPDNNRITGTKFGVGADRNITIDDWGIVSPPAGLFGRGLVMFNGYAVGWGCTNKVTGGDVHYWFLYPSTSASESASPSPSAGDLFCDGFESGDTSAWTDDLLVSGSSINLPAAMEGSYGLEIANPGDLSYVEYSGMGNQSHLRCGFRFDPNSFTIGDGNVFEIGFFDQSGVEIRKSSGDIQVRAWGIDYSSWYTITDGPHTIEVDWKAESTPGGGDGYTKLYIDGILKENMVDANYGLLASFVDLGYTNGTAFTGSIYLDDFCCNNNGTALF